MFELFMKNPYWKSLYDRSSENLKKYYYFKFSNNGREYTPQMLRELNDIKSKFTREDWEELISHNEGQAKREYTRQMMEKF